VHPVGPSRSCLQKYQNEESHQIPGQQDHAGMRRRFVGRTGAGKSTLALAGGIIRVLQNGKTIEKGAVSLTVIREGTLTAERARSIRDRNAEAVGEGDRYFAAALSLVLHSRSPMVPTFRSDARLFLVRGKESGKVKVWFGGGADLTPYYLFENDIKEFHATYLHILISSL